MAGSVKERRKMEPSGLFPFTARPDIGFARLLNRLFFQDRREGFFIECGANTGFGNSVCRFFEMQLDWTGVNIEANPHCYGALVIERPNCLNLNLALGGVRKEAEFHFPTDRKRKKATRFGGLVQSTWPGSKTATVIVNVDTYENIIRDNNIEKVDLFVLDVEGYELEVLKGIGACTVLPEVFVIETAVVGEPVVTEIVKSLGYKIAPLKGETGRRSNKHNTYYIKENLDD